MFRKQDWFIDVVIVAVGIALMIGAVKWVMGDEADASLVTQPDGMIDRQIQDWDNDLFLKFGTNMKLVVVRSECPDERVPRGSSCVTHDDPRTIYLSQIEPQVYVHEKVHSWDMSMQGTWESAMVRGGFVRHMQYEPGDWWSGPLPTYFSNYPVGNLAERFADAGTYCATVPRSYWGEVLPRRQGYGWEPTKQQARRICWMLTKYMH